MSGGRLLLCAGWIVCLSGCANQAASQAWKASLQRHLMHLGDRNWVVIAEASFPAHSRKGVVQASSPAGIPATLDEVLRSLESTEHVRPRIFTARELRYVDNDEAPGVDLYRSGLETALHGHPRTEIDYQSLITLLEDAGETFDVLVIRTSSTLPYASVFIELQHGYWDAEAESNLRARMAAAEKPAQAKPETTKPR